MTPRAALSCFAFLLLGGLPAAGLTVGTDVASLSVAPGENTTLILWIELGADDERGPVKFAPPPVEGAARVDGPSELAPSPSRGPGSPLRLSYRFVIHAAATPGEIRVGSTTVHVGSRALATQPVSIAVARPASGAASAPKGGDPRSHVLPLPGELVRVSMDVTSKEGKRLLICRVSSRIPIESVEPVAPVAIPGARLSPVETDLTVDTDLAEDGEMVVTAEVARWEIAGEPGRRLELPATDWRVLFATPGAMGVGTKICRVGPVVIP